MKRLNQFLEHPWAANTFALSAAVVLYLLLSHLGAILSWFGSLWQILLPVVIGVVLAYLMDPIARFFEHRVLKKVKKETRRRTLAVLIAILLVLVLVALFFVAIVPSLIDSISTIISNADVYYAGVTGFLARLGDTGLGLHLDLSTLTETLQSHFGSFFTNITSNMQTIVSKASSIGTSLFNWVVGFILAIYFMLDKHSLVPGLNLLRRAAMTHAHYERSNVFWHRCDEIFIQYIGCNLLDAAVVGTANALIMLCLGMPYVSLISVVVGVTNLLPTFGPMIGAVVGAFILVIAKPIYALYFLIFTLVLQSLDAYVIKPKLFSNSFGIPAVWTLVAIILGGKLFGVIGILFAIPIVAVLAFLFQERFLPWLQRRSEARERRLQKEIAKEKAEEREEA